MRKKVIRLIAICAILIASWLIGLNPDIDNEDSLCPSIRFFHLPCPGCGLTKSIIHFYRGEFVESFHYHYWGGAFVLFCLFLMVLIIDDMIRTKDRADLLLDNYRLWQIVSICVLLTYLFKLALFFEI